jgi:hypothetical protein
LGKLPTSLSGRLEEVTDGKYDRERVVNDVAPSDRDIAMIQSPALPPYERHDTWFKTAELQR